MNTIPTIADIRATGRPGARLVLTETCSTCRCFTTISAYKWSCFWYLIAAWTHEKLNPRFMVCDHYQAHADFVLLAGHAKPL
jgi:hypothetical protein